MIILQPNDPTADSLRWYSSNLIATPHAMFTRHGGFSFSPFAGLNLGSMVGDDSNLVLQNRKLLKQTIKIQHLVSAIQVHGDRIIIAENIREDSEFNDADALITNQAGVGLLIQQADCQAILLHDPVQDVIAAIHSGWKGSVLNIAAKTIARMQKNFATSPADIKAVISPSLGSCCAEFVNCQMELPESFYAYQVKPCYFDFWEISRNQLIEAGILNTNIDITRLCTSCSDDFFSYRKAVRQSDGRTGRNGSVIALPSIQA